MNPKRMMVFVARLAVAIFSATIILSTGCGKSESPGQKEEIKFVSGEDGEGKGEVEYYTCTMHPSVKQKAPGKCPICAMDLVPVYKESAPSQMETQEEVDYYTCTMHPSVKQKEPGKCPICAMDLVPVYKEGASPQAGAQEKQGRTVNVPRYQQQLIGVQRDTVKVRPVAQTVRTVGHVTYDETKIAAINLKFSGWIEKLYANYTGQFVKKGQPLFDIYSPELVATQEEYLQTLRSEASGQELRLTGQSNRTTDDADNRENSLLKSSRDRLLLWGISEKQIVELAKTGTPKLKLTIYSPISGYVLEKNALEGSHAKAGTDLYSIADLSTIWVHADIYEYELPVIKVGQKATIRLSYDPGAEYTGRVDYIYPTLQVRTRTAKVRLVFPNPNLKLKPDMYADVEIADEQEERLIVPETAVLNTGMRQLVFVDRGNGRFEPREIKLGVKAGRYYTVLEGLESGEVIVKSGNFLIDAEAHVQGVLQTLQPEAEK